MAEEFSLEAAEDLFKRKYIARSDAMYNTDNVLEGRIKKTYNFVGKDEGIETHLSYSGSVGAGSLPVAGVARYKQAILTRKRVYGRCQVEREAIKAASTNEGAFVKATKESVKRTVESYMRFNSFLLFGDGTGVIGKGDGATNVSGAGTEVSPYVVTISAATFKEASWEEEDLVQYVSGLNADNSGGSLEGGLTVTNLLKVVNVNIATRAISLVGTSAALAALVGAGPVATTSGFVFQRSYSATIGVGKNAVPMGLYGVTTPYAGVTSLYGIDIQRRWQSFVKDASGVPVSTDLMNEIVLGLDKKVGASNLPNMIIMHQDQFRNVLALLEDQKRYKISNRNLVKGKELMGRFSFTGVEFMSSKGPIPMFTDRFCEGDRIYFLNDNYIERKHAPGFGWFADDGTIFMRVQDEDSYESRYGGYYENFITPTFQGALYGLAK